MEEIIPGLWLGDAKDASKHEDDFDASYPIYRWITFDEFGGKMEIKAEVLDSLAVLIHEERLMTKKILVYCAAGIERSPLVVAWYLCTYAEVEGITTLNQAYDYIKDSRKVYDRSDWVDWTERKERDFL